MKEKKSRILCGITIALLFVSAVVLYMVHEKVPFMMDDIWYSTKLSDETPIASFRDIVESQIWHYFNWGGRSMTHGILQLTLLAGERAADILNVLVTFLLAGMICRMSEVPGKGTGNVWHAKLQVLPWLFAAVGMLLGFNANWKMSMFWQAGAANYLYITVFILGFLICYLREFPDGSNAEEEAHHIPGITFWIVPLGILAGWSNENMGPMAWILSLIVIVARMRQKQMVRIWMLLGNLACFFGSVMVVAAPGNFVRSAQVASNGYGVFWKLFLRGYGESTAMLDYLFLPLLLTGFLLILCKSVLKLSVGRRNLLLLLGALLSWGAMVLSPHYPDRATFGTMVLLLCVILNLAGRILRAKGDLQNAFWGVSFFIWLRGMFFLGEFLAICWGWIR